MQLRIFAKILGITLIGVGLMAVVFYFFSSREIDSSYRQFHIHAKNFLDLLLPTVLLSVVLALIASVAITVFLPIKIAGPLFRIENALKDRVSSGDLSLRFTLRKGDEMGELADAVNICLEKLSRKIEPAITSVNNLEALMARTGELDKKDLEAHVLTIRNSLTDFTL